MRIPRVTAALKKAIANGTSFGAPTELEITLAKMVKKAFPSIEMVRMVSSGTEATMSAIRVARGFTGRDKILKFDGCYHGHADSLLVKAGSGVATFGLPDSPGVPADLAKLTLTVAYNDLAAVKEMASREGRADRLHHRRAGCRQHGLRAARAGFPRRAARRSATSTASCLSSTK